MTRWGDLWQVLIFAFKITSNHKDKTLRFKTWMILVTFCYLGMSCFTKQLHFPSTTARAQSSSSAGTERDTREKISRFWHLILGNKLLFYPSPNLWKKCIQPDIFPGFKEWETRLLLPCGWKDQTRADQGRACHASVSPRTRGDIFIDSQAMKNWNLT